MTPETPASAGVLLLPARHAAPLRTALLQPPIHEWGISADLRPLTGGHRNIAFRTVGLRQDLVFKSTRRTTAQLVWLGQVQEIARACGFVVPGLRQSRNGRLTEEGWTCERFVAGRHLSAAESASLLPRLRDFHAATTGVPQRPGFRSARDLLDQTTAAGQAFGGDVDLAALPAELAARCRAAWAIVTDREEAVIHGDLNPGNLIRSADGATALIDWDECRRDLVLFDLGALRDADEAERRARLAWEVACCWQVEPEYARKLALRLD